MKKYIFFAFTVTFLLSIGYAQERSFVSKGPKVIVFELKGQGPDAKPTVNLFSLPVSLRTQYVGYAESVNGQKVKLVLTDWVDDQFNGPNGFYFLEILAGPDIRAITDITDTFGAEGTIVTADDMSAYLTDQVKVRIGRHHTLFSVFGVDNRMGFTPGTALGEGDEVILFNADTQQPSVYYFSSKVAAWVDASAPLQPVEDFIIYPEQGLFLKRRGRGSLPLIMVGDIRVEPVAGLVMPGVNILSNLPPAPTPYDVRRHPLEADLTILDLPEAALLRAKTLQNSVTRTAQMVDTQSSSWVEKVGLNSTDRIHVVSGTAIIYEHPANAPPELLLLMSGEQSAVGGRQ